MKITKKAASGFAIAFLVAAGSVASIEWNGYEVFDRETGDNLLCRVDPHCRQMTPGEIEMARSIFSDSINYNHVKIFNRKYMLVAGEGHGLSPNGNIYVDGTEKWSEDYAKDLGGAPMLIHELAHVWQVQNGRELRTEAFSAFFKHDFDYSAAYDYDLSTHQYYRDYNLEQQADIVQSYYLGRLNFRQMTEGLDMTKPYFLYKKDFNELALNACRDLVKHEDKLMQVLPLQPEKGCEAYWRYLKPAPKTRSPAQSPSS